MTNEIRGRTTARGRNTLWREPKSIKPQFTTCVLFMSFSTNGKRETFRSPIGRAATRFPGGESHVGGAGDVTTVRVEVRGLQGSSEQ